jgi:hypothetical protein
MIEILSATMLFSQETCAQKAKRDNTVLKRRAPTVVSTAKKIVQTVPFTKRETDAMPIHDVEDMAIDGYNAGFACALEPGKNIKSDIMKRFQKSLDDITHNLSPDDSTFANAYVSKIISIFSKSFDVGFQDGKRPCPNY